MKKLSLVTCMILVVGCATVKENENQEEEKNNVIDYESFQKTAEIDDLGDTIWSYEGDQTAILNSLDSLYEGLGGQIMALLQNEMNKHCKSKVSLFPNPTSSFVTLDVDLGKGEQDFDVPSNEPPISFRYNLIFDEKIIYKDNIPNHKAQIIIPEHLLQKEGVYTIAYEFYQEGVLNCRNIISFIVIKNQK